MRVLLFASALLLSCASPVHAVKFAAPIQADGGSIPVGGIWGTKGGACSYAVPCAIADFLADPGPENELVLLDGTYRGADSLLILPEGMGGTASRPLFIHAENDGQVLIDAGLTGPALQIRGSWVRVEGVDLRSQVSSASVSSTDVPQDSDDGPGTYVGRTQSVTLRRVVAYKDPILCAADPCVIGTDKPTYEAVTPENSHVLEVSDADNVLLEDVAAFGRGRKTIQFYRSTDVTARRVWGRSEGNWPYIASSNLKTFTPQYRTHDGLAENVLMTVGGSLNTQVHPADYADTPQIISTDAQPHVDPDDGSLTDTFIDEGRDPHNVGTRILHSIAYGLPTSKLMPGHGIRIGSFGPYPGKGMKGVEIANTVVWLPAASGGNRLALANCDEPKAAGELDGCDWAYGSSQIQAPLTYGQTTTRGGAGSDSVRSDWSESPAGDAAASAELGIDIYTPGGVGAEICFRSVGGTLTGDPLWPWPMQDRIKAATTASLWETADVMADLATLFAEVPQQCQRPPTSTSGFGG